MPAKKSNKIFSILIGLVALLLVLAVTGVSLGWFGKNKPIEVDMAKAKTSVIVEKVSASGSIQPVIEVKISPDVPGEIIELNVEEGDSVVKEQLLIRIRPDNLKSILERAHANLNQQKANQAEASARLSKSEAQYYRTELEFQRQEKLYQQKVISVSDYELSEANYKVAQNDLESVRQSVKAAKFIVASAQASVNEAQENVRLTKVEAPMSGIISKLSVELGERVVGTQQMAGTEMLRIADLNRMEVRVNVNENDIIRVSLGDTAEIDVDAYAYLKTKFLGVVTAIANTANDKLSEDAVTEFEVKILIMNSSFQDLLHQGQRTPFRPGMTASVEIITDRKENVLAVPLSAVTIRVIESPDQERKETGNDEETEVVFIAQEGIAKISAVTTGISDFQNIEITSGLNEGDQIITGPFQVVSKKLKDGSPVSEKKKRERN